MEKSIRMFVLSLSLLLTVVFVQSITQTKLAKLDQSAMFTTNDVVTIKDRERQLDCLARNIYHEAGYEPFEGKVAVAQVTMNRANDSRFPSDVCGVVFQKNVFMERVVCQFSWYCDSAAKLRPMNGPAYKESYEVAKKVLLEGFRLDILKNAMYYHADYVNPKWGKPKIGQIGRHIFYKDI
jgi:spore germination cell wall hydrolase CwlJ-like protein